MNLVFSSKFWNVSRNSHDKLSTFKSRDEQRTQNSHEAPRKRRGRMFMQYKFISSSQLYRPGDLPSAVPTFYDHFPKPRRRGRPTSFRGAGWRRCHSTLIGRCRRGRRKLPPGKTADLSAFTWKCTIRYHAMVMTVVWSRGRSRYRVSLCPSGYSSVVEWRFFFERSLLFWLGKSSLWLPVTENEKSKY